MIQTVHCVDGLIGGVATVLLTYAEACDDIAFNFLSISPVEDKVKERVESLGGSVIVDGIDNNLGLGKSIKMAKEMTGSKIFHVHRNWHNLRPAALAKRAGYEIVISHSHNVFASSSKVKDVYHALFKRLIKRFADASWGCSPEAIAFLYGERPKNPLFVPNPINFSSFRFSEAARFSKRTELGLGDSFTLVHAGLPIPQKNHPFLLHVFAEVIKERPGSKLLLLGPDKDKDCWLYDLAERLGIAGSVVFCGYVEDVADFYAASDLFVFPSFNEGLSLALCEAQAEGLGFVASDAITRSSDLFGNGCFLPLDKGVGPWVEKILEFDTGRKTPTKDSVATCKFNIKFAAPLLSATYRALLNGVSQQEIELIWGNGI